MRNSKLNLLGLFCFAFIFAVSPGIVLAQADFNPHLIISDQELQDSTVWTRSDVQQFLDSKGSYLRNFQTQDASGTLKSASDIIFDTALQYQINPKYILVTLQKEQSLVTDDSPTQKQLDWAAGYGVCDNCNLDDPKVVRFKGFGKQVDGAAGIMRWYYNNEDKPFVKKKDSLVRIDNQDVTPASWATAFLYTYTPHLHGNRNFWRIWDTWFQEEYPNGTVLLSATTGDYWVIEDGKRRKFKNRSALISRYDPKSAVTLSDVDLNNFPIGAEIAFSNYSILRSSSTTYLLDYDKLRPFASDAVVRALGYNPQEIIDVDDADLAGYSFGTVITATSTAPEGVIYQITDAKNSQYLLKDGVLYPITNPKVVEANFRNIPIEKHRMKDLVAYQMADQPLQFRDGTLLQVKDSDIVYVIDRGKKRRIADAETFVGLGYKRSNVVTVDLVSALNIPSGESLFLNNSLISSKSKFLGDSAAPVSDLYKTNLPVYLVAEYPSGRIVSGKNIDTPRPIASLTKLLTAYESLNQNFDLSKSMTFSDKLFGADATAQFKNGEKIKNKDIFTSMLVASLNSAARMVANSTALSGEKDVVAAINARLADWGADNTSIVDVTGLSEKNQSSARDLLKIFVKVLADKNIKNALSLSSYSFRSTAKNGASIKHGYKDTNQLLSQPNRPYSILATKTGYTDEAGGVMIMLVEAKKPGKQYVVVTLGNSDYKHRFTEPGNIASWAVGSRSVASTK